MKYWTLSLQIKEIVFKQPADKGRLLCVAHSIFWTIESIILLTCILCVVATYELINNGTDYPAYLPFNITIQIGLFLSCLGPLLLLMDAIKRLRSCI
jgi:hypothetical protein